MVGYALTITYRYWLQTHDGGSQCLPTKRSTKGGEPYYEWLLYYVDDLLVVSENPQATMDAISKTYDLRDSVKPPERYLGANTSKWQLPDGREVWSMSGKDYIKNAINMAKEMAARDGVTFSTGKKAERPMS